MSELITEIKVGEDRIDVFEGRNANYEKCVVVSFTGPGEWGVTMNIHHEELNSFVNRPDVQSRFLAFAKEKLGLEVA